MKVYFRYITSSRRCFHSNIAVFQFLSNNCVIIRGELEILEMDVPCFGSQNGMNDAFALCYIHNSIDLNKVVFSSSFFVSKCRLHLLEEDSIDFSEFNLRNNVAQICVFEVLGLALVCFLEEVHF